MSGIGAASFVEGLQGGIAARDTMDRNKQFKQMRGMEISGRRIQGEANSRELLGKDFDQAAFDEEWGQFETGKDPALLRFGKWMGGKMGGMFGGKGEESVAAETPGFVSPEIQPAGKQASGVTTFGIDENKKAGPRGPGFADGGQVYTAEERMKRSYGDYYLTEEEAANADSELVGYGGVVSEHRPRAGVQGIPTSGGGAGEAWNDVKRAAGDTHTANAMQGFGEIRAEDKARYGAADSAYERGDAARQAVGGMGRGVATVAGGLATDLGLTTAIDAVKGFVGFDGGGEQAIPTDTPTTPEGAAIGAATNEPEPAENVSQRAIETAKEDTIENFDYKLLVDQGVRPEELPSMTTADWTGYRERMTTGAIMRGMEPTEAHQMVDQRITDSQMTGFNREAKKAMLYLQSGQAREASMALRQAYQYFPNGVTVKFGTMPDPKTGQPVIVTIASDEETGEPTGQPMIITVDRLSTMVENMSNPDAFRSWTKDGRDLQMEINKLQSVDDYRQGSLGISQQNADTNRIDALTGGASGGGMTHSQRTASSKLYMTEMKEKGFMEDSDLAENPRMVEGLVGAMLRLEMGTGLPQGIVVEEVMAAYGEGGDAGAAAVQQLLENQTR